MTLFPCPFLVLTKKGERVQKSWWRHTRLSMARRPREQNWLGRRGILSLSLPCLPCHSNSSEFWASVISCMSERGIEITFLKVYYMQQWCSSSQLLQVTWSKLVLALTLGGCCLLSRVLASWVVIGIFTKNWEKMWEQMYMPYPATRQQCQNQPKASFRTKFLFTRELLSLQTWFENGIRGIRNVEEREEALMNNLGI